jgi:hypothetical protein
MSLARQILCKLFCTLSVVVMLLQVAQPYIYGAVMAHGMDGHHSLLANAEEDALRTSANEEENPFHLFVAEQPRDGALGCEAGYAAQVCSARPGHGPHVPLFISLRDIRI